MDKLLQELIAIPSVCSDIPVANHAIDFVETKLQKHQLYSNRFSCNGFPSLVATTRNTRRPKVMLYAHLDVVDAPEERFKLQLENGKYLGRGVLDMKQAAAAYLHVLDGISDTLQNYDLGIMFTTDEEYFGNFGTGYLVGKGYIPGVCVMPDSGFGTNWQIEEFAKGCWFAQITALGISAHGSRPWEGESASIKLVKALNDIARLFKEAQKPDTATLNLGIMRAGNSINQIPAAASASLDIRYCDMPSFFALKQSIEDVCDRHDVVIKTVREWNEPTISDITHPLIRTFTKHVRQQTGITPLPFKTFGATDARFFQTHNVPCILMSPPGKYAHGSNEELDEQGYEQFKLILRSYLDEVALDSASSGNEMPTDALTIIE
jgi:succinyl-diaminopimelate desuccinylase